MRHIFILCFAGFSITACATGYQVGQGIDTALVTFEKGDFDGLGLGRSTSKQYNTPANAGSCDAPKLLANFTWIGPEAKTKQIEAGKAMTIAALTIDQNVSAGVNEIRTDQKTTCSSRVTFTPVAGESYRIKLVETASGACSLDFVNAETGNTPETARIEDQYSCLVPSTP